MADLHQLLLQISIVLLFVLLSPIAGKALNNLPGLSMDINKPKYSFDSQQGAMGDGSTDYDDESYQDPADEKQDFYDSNYVQPFEANPAGEQVQLLQSVNETLGTNKQNEMRLMLKDSQISKDAKYMQPLDDDKAQFLELRMLNSPSFPENNDAFQQLALQGSPRKMDTGNLSSPSESVDFSSQSAGNLNAGSAPESLGTNNRSSEVNQPETNVKNSKRGVLRNQNESQTGRGYVNGSVKVELDPTQRFGGPVEKSLHQEPTTNETIKNEAEMADDPEPLSGSDGDAAVATAAVLKELAEKEQREMSGPQSPSSVIQQQGNISHGISLKYSYEKSSDTREVNSTNGSLVVNSSTNNDKSTIMKNGSDKYPAVIAESNSTLNSSSSIKFDGQSVSASASGITNLSKDDGHAQEITEEVNNNTGALAPGKEGTVTQQSTSKAPMPVKPTSSKVPSAVQTSKPSLLPSSNGSASSSAITTKVTSTRPKFTGTTDQETSVDTDDSDMIIDEPPESSGGKGSHTRQPYQGELVEEGLPMVHSPPVNDQDSHFFAYFASLLITAALGYVVYHNRNKILALLLEGRRGRVSSSSRRGSSAGSIGRRRGRGGGGGGAKYQPLHTSLDQVMTSNGTENGGDSSSLDRVY